MSRLSKLERKILEVEAMTKQNRPVSGMNVSVNDVPGGGGRSISAQPGGGSSSVVAGSHPFKLLNASDEVGFKVRVVYGMVNGEEPDGMSPGDTPPYILDVAITGYVYLVITTSSNGPGFTITSLTIGFDDTVPADSSATFTYYLEIGSVSIDGDVMTLAQSVTASLWFNVCRNWFSNPPTYGAVWSQL